MSVQVLPLHAPISYLIKLVGETSVDLFTVDFTTGEVVSSVLPASATRYLQERLAQVMAAVPVKADVEAGFAGLVRSLVSIRQAEGGADIADPAHLGLTIPFSTSAPFNEFAGSILGGEGAGGAVGGGGGDGAGLPGSSLFWVDYTGGVATFKISSSGPVVCTFDWYPAAKLPRNRYDFGYSQFQDGRVVIKGGATDGGSVGSDETVVYDPSGSFVVLAGPSHAGPGKQFSMCQMNSGGVLSAGGLAPGPTDVVEMLDPYSLLWQAKTPLPDVGWGFPLVTGAFLGDVAFQVGGMFGVGFSTSASLRRYNGVFDTWLDLDPMSTPRRWHSAVFTPGASGILAIGGEDGSEYNYLSSCEIYGLFSTHWALTGSLHVARAKHGAILLDDGRVLVAGGVPSVPGAVDTAEVYDPFTGLWSYTANSMPSGHFDFGSSNAGNGLFKLSDGRVIVAGGRGADNQPTSAVAIFDPLTNLWAPLPPMIQEHASCGGGVLDSCTVLIVAGRTLDGLLNKKAEKSHT